MGFSFLCIGQIWIRQEVHFLGQPSLCFPFPTYIQSRLMLLGQNIFLYGVAQDRAVLFLLYYSMLLSFCPILSCCFDVIMVAFQEMHAAPMSTINFDNKQPIELSLYIERNTFIEYIYMHMTPGFDTESLK